jgi:uncharacterized protein (DUF934 family)
LRTRASGPILPDQLGFLTEVGFDSFEVSDRFPEAVWSAPPAPFP